MFTNFSNFSHGFKWSFSPPITLEVLNLIKDICIPSVTPLTVTLLEIYPSIFFLFIICFQWPKMATGLQKLVNVSWTYTWLLWSQSYFNALPSCDFILPMIHSQNVISSLQAVYKVCVVILMTSDEPQINVELNLKNTFFSLYGRSI